MHLSDLSKSKYTVQPYEADFEDNYLRIESMTIVFYTDGQRYLAAIIMPSGRIYDMDQTGAIKNRGFKPQTWEEYAGEDTTETAPES